MHHHRNAKLANAYLNATQIMKTAVQKHHRIVLRMKRSKVIQNTAATAKHHANQMNSAEVEAV